MSDSQLATQHPGQVAPFEEMERASKYAAESGLFGITKPAQAMCLFMICQAEGVNYIEALRRYHLVDNKPSMRADYMQGKFMANGGGILWHVRTDDICAATFFADETNLDDVARQRAITRFDWMWKFNSEEDPAELSKLIIELNKLAMDGEETIIRTFEDAEEKGLTKSLKKDDHGKWVEKEKMNWKQSPRQMLTARVVTEGVRLIAPGLIAGVYTPDEVEDIVQAEKRDREEFIDRALKAPDLRDRVAIQAMIDLYLEEAKTAKPTRKSELLGLASELRTKLADLELEDDEIPGIAKPAAAPAREEPPAAAEPELRLDGELAPEEIKWEDYVLQHVASKVLRGRKLGSFTAEELVVIAKKTTKGLDSPDSKIRAEAHYIKEGSEALSKEAKK